MRADPNFNEVAWALDIIRRTHLSRHGNLLVQPRLPYIEECTECLRYWRRLIEPQGSRIPNPIRHYGSRPHYMGDPDDYRESREEIRRDKGE